MGENLRICVIKLSALGDCCLFLPAFNAIRRTFLAAEITWVIAPLEYRLLEGLSGVNFVIYDKKSGLKGAITLRKTLKNYLNGAKFDYLLMPQESLRASVLSLFVPAKIRVGYDKDRAKDFQRFFCNAQIATRREPHLVENALDFAIALAKLEDKPLKEPTQIEWNLPIPQDERENAAKFAAQIGRYFIVSPIANAVRFNWRNWTAEGYAQAIDYAAEKYGLTPVITGVGSERENETITEISAILQSKIIDLNGKTSLKFLLALIEKAEFVIAPDSGPGHFAAALGTPAIALLACADPRRAAPFQKPSYCVDRYEEALLKFAGKKLNEVKFGARARDPKAMREITPTDVTQMIDRAMSDVIFKRNH
ncbi:MAG: glycosyltransferase family 9 protein [Helicobacteraceae bacterium]|nr:glycosyltransferase family 9 protein [Helicobacteraceae bacterium]